MKKEEFLVESTTGALAYYHYLSSVLGEVNAVPNMIEQDDNVLYAEVALISTFFMMNKEKIVQKEMNLNVSSKLIDESLEKSISCISKKIGNKYLLDNYEADSPAEIVTIIRNKFAHGDYTIDIKKKCIVLNKEGQEVKIKIEKLTEFIILAFMNLIRFPKTHEVERIQMSCDARLINTKERLENFDDIKLVLNHSKLTKYKLYNPKEYITKEALENFSILMNTITKMKNKEENPTKILKVYEKLCNRENTTFRSYEYRITKKDTFDKIEELVKNNPTIYQINMQAQIELLLGIIQEIEEKEYSDESPLIGNIINLMILNEMLNDKTFKYWDIFEKINVNNKMILESKAVEQVVSSLISCFNTLYAYPLEDLYMETSYSINREDQLDFSKLDLSMLNPSILEINDTPLKEAKLKKNASEKRVNEYREKKTKLKDSYFKVHMGTCKIEALNNIKNNLVNCHNTLKKEENNYLERTITYNDIKEDFANNELYFKNKAIIIGLRDSIAHGNVKINKYDGELNKIDSVEVVFEDIYNGEKHFELKAKVTDLEKLFNEQNVHTVEDFLNNRQQKKHIK